MTPFSGRWPTGCASAGVAADVRRHGLRGEFWPSADEELLVRAAAVPGPSGAAAWKELRPRLDLDALPSEAHRLLPQVWRTLHQAGVDDRDLPRLRGLHRRTWYLNRVTIDRARRVLDVLAEHGIDTMLLKGAALIAAYYRDPGARPMADVDVLVPTARAEEVLELLGDLGLHRGTMHGLPVERLLRRTHGIPLRATDGRALDLHWQLSMELLLPGDHGRSTDDVWAAAETADLAGAPVRIPCPADLLLHVVVHGSRLHGGDSLHWIPDAATVIGEGRVDWDRLVRQAAARRAHLQLLDALTYLRSAIGVEVPHPALEALRAAPRRLRDRYVAWGLGRNPHGRLGAIPYGLARYLRRTDGSGAWRTASGVPAFLQERWGLKSGWGIPAHAARRVGTLVRRRLRTGGPVGRR
jgi:hypothetical protein